MHGPWQGRPIEKCKDTLHFLKSLGCQGSMPSLGVLNASDPPQSALDIPRASPSASEAHYRDNQGQATLAGCPSPTQTRASLPAHTGHSQHFPELEAQSKDQSFSSSESHRDNGKMQEPCSDGGDLSAPPRHFHLQVPPLRDNTF